MIWYIITGVFGIAAGAAGMYKILSPKIKVTQEIDQRILDQNSELKDETVQLLIDSSAKRRELISLEEQISAAAERLKDTEIQASQAAEAFYKTHMQLAEERMDRALEAEGQKFQQAIDAFQEELAKTKEEGSAQLAKEIQEKREELDRVNCALDMMRQATFSAVDAAKRAEEIKTSSNFYRIQLSNADLGEIRTLRSMCGQLRNQEPINKVIWKYYYEKPVTDLIGRVVGEPCSGIYKITNIENQMCYVGQAVDIGNRWKQHIRRGVGAENPTRNKLYPAMQAVGPEGFTFEVIEKCDRALLDEREDFWQDYFKAKEFGYSMK